MKNWLTGRKELINIGVPAWRAPGNGASNEELLSGAGPAVVGTDDEAAPLEVVQGGDEIGFSDLEVVAEVEGGERACSGLQVLKDGGLQRVGFGFGWGLVVIDGEVG